MIEFIKFELKYRLERPVTYIYFAILLVLAFIATSTDVIQAGGSGGKVMENAPIAIAVIMGVFTIFGIFIISAVMGVPVLRDFEHNTYSMIFSTPVSKFKYLSGKYIGSLIITILIMSGLLWGAMLGQALPCSSPLPRPPGAADSSAPRPRDPGGSGQPPAPELPSA